MGKVSTVSHIGVLSYGKIGAMLGVIFGFIFGLIYGLFGGLMVMAAGEAGLGVLMIFGGIILGPLFGALTGFLNGVISGWLYNVAAGWVGGIELEFS